MSGHAVVRATAAYRLAVAELRDNEGQWQAYNSTRSCVVLAGPGSGKTKTLTVKIARLLIEDVRSPRGIACLTYNTESARELKRRLERLGVQQSNSVFVGTVHSFCLTQVLLPFARLARIALPAELRVATPSEQDGLFGNAVAAVLSADEPPSNWRTRAEEYRRTHLDRDSPDWQEDEQLSAIVDRYEALLREQGMIDFEDMVLVGLRLIESNRWVRRAVRAKFPVLVVDEYQDLGVPLDRIVRSLCFRAAVRLFAVGDPDQSIYGFTGARPGLLQDLAGDQRVETVRLRFNYRSGPTIVAASEIALGEARGYESRAQTAGTVDFYERPQGIADQARFICRELIPSALERMEQTELGDVAVLYLDKNDGDVIALAASDKGFKCVRIDRGGPYARTPLTRWLEECARWCSGGWRTGEPRLSDLFRRYLSFRRASSRTADPRFLRRQLVRFLLSRRVPDQRLAQWLAEFKEACLDEMFDADPTLGHEQQTLVDLLAASDAGPCAEWAVTTFAGQGGAPDHLNLITLHSAKGLEFKVVIMMGMDQGRIPRWDARDRGRREARRLFYVGLTRAKDEVHLTYSGWTMNRYGRRFARGPSEFLIEVRERLSDGG